MTELPSRPTSEPDPESVFVARVRFVDPIHIVALSGELDLASRAAAIHACAAPERLNVLVDLADLAFMDCAGYSAFVVSTSILEHRGGSLVLRNAVGEPRRLLALLDELERGLCAPSRVALSGTTSSARSRPFLTVHAGPSRFGRVRLPG